MVVWDFDISVTGPVALLSSRIDLLKIKGKTPTRSSDHDVAIDPISARGHLYPNLFQCSVNSCSLSKNALVY